MPGSQKFSRNCNRKVLSNFLEYQKFAQKRQAISKIILAFFSGQIHRSVVDTWKLYASDQAAAHGNKPLHNYKKPTQTFWVIWIKKALLNFFEDSLFDFKKKQKKQKTCVLLFQIALEIIWSPVPKKFCFTI